MMKKQALLIAILALLSFSASAMAEMFATEAQYVNPSPGSNDSLQTVLDNITTAPNPGDSSVDVYNDAVKDSVDSYWKGAAGGTTAATMVIELTTSPDTNTFGIFDLANPNNKLLVFDGAASTSFKAVLDLKADGSIKVVDLDIPAIISQGTFSTFNNAPNFGFYMDSSARTNGGIWYSDTDLNTDDADHMRAYQGTGVDTLAIGTTSPGPFTSNHFILAWEQGTGGGDESYQDMVLLVESMQPIPVPGAVLLGILGLSAAGMKLRKRS